MAAKFLEIGEFGFAKAMEAAGIVFDLNGKGIFVGADAFDGLAGGGGSADEEKVFGEAVGRFGENFGEESGAAALADGGEIGAISVAGGVEHVARGAGTAGVEFGAVGDVAGNGIGGNFAELADVSDEIGERVVIEEPAFGHDGRDAVGDEGFESVVIGSARESNAIKRGAAAAFAVNAVTKGTVAFEKFFAGSGISGRGFFVSRLGGSALRRKKQEDGAHGGQRNLELNSLHIEKSWEGGAQCFGSVSPETRRVNERHRRH